MFKVRVICAWPRISWTIFGCSPLENIRVAKVCRRSWNLISGNPARLSKGLKERLSRLLGLNGVPILDSTFGADDARDDVGGSN